MSDNNKNKIRRRTSSSSSNQSANSSKKMDKRARQDVVDRDRDMARNLPSSRRNDSRDYPEDIKTYNPRRSTRESRVKIVREASYKNDDKDLKTYNPKRRTKSQTTKDSNSESVNKKGKIRIKKQASSGSGSRQYQMAEKNRHSGGKDNKVIKFRPGNNYDEANEYDDYDEEYYEEDIKKTKRKKIMRRIMKRILTIVLVLFVIGGSAGFLYVRSVISDMPVLTKKMVRESYINKDPVPLKDIPKTLQNAVIAVEDQRFYKRGGVDFRSILRSFVNNLTSDTMQGGSTIDMQLSKNILTNNQRTIKRKIQDMYNAIMLNKIMTKDEILEAYLNNIYMGKSAYGVQAGAQLYFGKNVSNLNFGQCTMLAGITNNPRLYQDYEQAKKRQAIVLYKMYKLGYIKEYVYKAQLYRDTPFKSEIDK